MTRILTISLNYSPLIDVLKYAYYNIDMDENAIITLIAIETATPKRRITRSVGAIYVALIVLIIGCISIGNLLYANWQIPRHITQPILYAMLAGFGYWIYRRHYLSYRYTLTNEMFAIEQIKGNGDQTIAAMELREIRNICGYVEKSCTGKRTIFASIPPRRETTWITAQLDGKEVDYSISASEDFIAKLTAQWRLSQTRQEQ